MKRERANHHVDASITEGEALHVAFNKPEPWRSSKSTLRNSKHRVVQIETGAFQVGELSGQVSRKVTRSTADIQQLTIRPDSGQRPLHEPSLKPKRNPSARSVIVLRGTLVLKLLPPRFALYPDAAEQPEGQSRHDNRPCRQKPDHLALSADSSPALAVGLIARNTPVKITAPPSIS